MAENSTPHPNLSDKEIWNQFRAGNDDAFERIYNSYFDRLYNYGCQFSKDHALVEDTLQELFLDLRRRALSPVARVSRVTDMDKRMNKD